ncbi:MAG: hypothetical protein ACI9KE_001776 [Polyangiales bacterium]|jgi:hypothetical protein
MSSEDEALREAAKAALTKLGEQLDANNSEEAPPEREIMPATWAILAPHAQRNALFLVMDPASLEEAADALAADDKTKVAKWVESGALRRPAAAELKHWDSSPVAFTAVIVQPFVLAKPISLATGL